MPGGLTTWGGFKYPVLFAMVSNSEAFQDERDFLHPPLEWIGLIIRVHENTMSVNISHLLSSKVALEPMERVGGLTSLNEVYVHGMRYYFVQVQLW